MGVRAASGLTNGVLRYETGMDREKSELGLLDLASAMEPGHKHSFSHSFCGFGQSVNLI